MLKNDSKPTCGVLYVDDEEKALKYFRLAFAAKYTIHTAASAREGLDVLRRESKDIAIILSDQRMPEMLGAEFLGRVREEFPHVVRILTTAFSDLNSAIEAVNKGHIYQYVVKPWEIPELEMVLRRAADYYHVLAERNELFALKMETLQRILCSDRLNWLLLSSRSLGVAEQSAFRRALVAMVGALPDTLNPAATGGASSSPRRFEIGTLIHDEYANASKCLDALDAFRSDAAAGESTRAIHAPLLAQLEALDSGAPAKPLQALLSSLIATYQLDPEEIALSVEQPIGARVLLRPRGEAFSTAAFARDLFGLLIEPETSELSLLLFQTLFAFALAGGSLTISVEPAASGGEAWVATFSPGEASDSPGEAIDVLHEKFSAADIARL
ncbi:MAG: response regulator [Terrimicrobiaceae bacterium]|nr:response regulator [Terrimicrobiaceae bacterium]